MKLTERHKINKIKYPKYYKLFENFAKESNSLYNQGLYEIKKNLKIYNKFLSYNTLDKICKNKPEKYNPYRRLPAQTAQQTLKILTTDISNYIRSIKDWSKNKAKYLGKPKFPNYKKSGDVNTFYLTNQQIKIKGDIILFPKVFAGFFIKVRSNFTQINQIRIKPQIDSFIVEAIYTIPDKPKNIGENIAGIDLGVKNLVALTFSNFKSPYLFRGARMVKYNYEFNSKKAKYQYILEKTQNKRSSKRLSRIYTNRNNFINNYFHTLSKKIIDLLIEANISKLVIGHNVNQKQNNNLKNFVSLPIFRLIALLKYKGEKSGIEVLEINESYTSGTSFVDYELPNKKNYDKKRRVTRDVFISNEGFKYDADVNASYQIIRKAKPEFTFNGNYEKLSPIHVYNI